MQGKKERMLIIIVNRSIKIKLMLVTYVSWFSWDVSTHIGTQPDIRIGCIMFAKDYQEGVTRVITGLFKGLFEGLSEGYQRVIKRSLK